MILYFLWILFLYHSKLISEGFCMNKGARPGTSCHPVFFMLLWYLMMYYYKLYCSIFSLHKGKVTKPKLSLQSVLLISSPFPLSYSEYFQIQSTLKYINIFSDEIFQQKIARLRIIGCQFFHYHTCMLYLLCSYLTWGSFYLNLSESKRANSSCQETN